MRAACRFFECLRCGDWLEKYEGSSKEIEEIVHRVKDIKRKYNLPP